MGPDTILPAAKKFPLRECSGRFRTQNVVDRRIRRQRIDPCKGIVRHACQMIRQDSGSAADACEFRGLDESGIVVRSFWQQIEKILRPEDGKQIRLGIAIDG